MDQLALDIFSKVFQYLDTTGQDILNIKLCNSDLKKLVESVHPLHHFISILLSIYSNQSSLYHLQIPSNFVLNEDMVEMIWKRTSTTTLFLKKPCNEKNFIRIITTFLTQFHTHPFCLQIMTWFPFDFKFLLLWSRREQSKENMLSHLMTTILEWEHLLYFISETKGYISNKTQEWLSNLWEFAVWNERRLYFPFQKVDIYWIRPEVIGETITPNSRNLVLFLSLKGAFNLRFYFGELIKNPIWRQHFMNDPIIWNALVSALSYTKYLSGSTEGVANCLACRFCSIDTSFERCEAHFSLQKEEDVIEIVKRNGKLLLDLPQKWRSSHKVLFAAIHSFPAAIEFATNEFKSNKEFVLKALEINAEVMVKLQYLYLNNLDFLRQALSKKPVIIKHLCKSVQQRCVNKDVILKEVREDSYC